MFDTSGTPMESNPFAALSLIVAPSILTNACALLVMSTSNRLARAVDRARELSKQLEGTNCYDSEDAIRRLDELRSTETRTLLLMRALRAAYVAMGSFALAALVSLLGAVSIPFGWRLIAYMLELGGVLAGVAAVGSIVYGSSLLLRETRMAVQVITARVTSIQAKMEN